MNPRRRNQIKKAVLCSAAICGIFLAATSANALNNTSFEAPDKGDKGYEYAPAAASWVFSNIPSAGRGAGLSGPNGPWKCDNISPDPGGDQFAFLQRDARITQDMSGLVIGGTYELNFFESYRTEKEPGNNLTVILDEGLSTEMMIYSNNNVTNRTWALRRSSYFVPAKTSYTLTFRTVNPLGGAGDRTTIIDGVALNMVDPPPVMYVKITNDANCDITVFKNYTHKLDFGQGAPGALINGVQFNAYNKAASGTLNFSRSATSGTLEDHAGNNPVGISGSLTELMRDMYYNNGNAAGGTTTWTLSGLTAGVTYDTRIYVRQWSPGSSRLATFVFDPDGAGPISNATVQVSEDDARSVGMAAAADPYYLNYRFTAVNDENLVITATQHNSGNSWHLYGITNEKVEPRLKAMSPKDNATGILVASDLVATFDAAVFKGTGHITLKQSSDNSVVESINVNSAAVTVSGSTVTIKPTVNLEVNTGYYVEMDAGAFVDHAARACPAVTGNSKWNFTTITDIFSFTKITNDSDCDIKASKTYTHKLDFGLGAPGALINGVQFAAYSNAANGTLNFSRAVSAGAPSDHLGNNGHNVSGNLVNLMTDMYYSGDAPAGGMTTWTLSGLTAGVNYETRIYVRQWAPGRRVMTLVFDPDGAGPISDVVTQINEDNAASVGMSAANDAYYISYPFMAVAGENLVITATTHLNNATWHLYGLTNEVIPPMGTILLIQ
ncbi:MAG: Ig-like domain-containing protein [Kiritimatiellae bacterium]|nr:Ig-like domain-containing protein [Kiritimatiellia bacterium]